jgi:hypothetical protein
MIMLLIYILYHTVYFCVCLFAYSGVQHILCCVFFLLVSSSCVYDASFSGFHFFFHFKYFIDKSIGLDNRLCLYKSSPTTRWNNLNTIYIRHRAIYNKKNTQHNMCWTPLYANKHTQKYTNHICQHYTQRSEDRTYPHMVTITDRDDQTGTECSILFN